MRALVIAVQTVQAYSRDRIFHAALVFAVLILLFAVFLSTLTIAENTKILLDFGFAATSMVGIGFSLLLGSTIVRREIDSRTIYTILSKPVPRNQYLWGKFLGGAFVVIVVHLVCAGTLGLAIVGSEGTIPAGFLAAVFLMILEGLLILALSLFFSLWLSSLFLGAALAFAAFLIGRSSYGLHLMAQKAHGIIKVLLEGLYAFFPSLQRFDIRDVVAYGKPYPEGMVQVSCVYFAAYLLTLMILSMLIFRRKDLT